MARMTMVERERLKSRTEGREQGRAEGRAAGQADIILAILEKPFGPMQGATVNRVRTAGPEPRKTWAKALINGCDLDGVFRPDAAR